MLKEEAMKDQRNFKFKEAIIEIERIVKELEDEAIDLDVALKKYERGVKLIRMCSEYLDKAELKLKELTRDQEGAPIFKETELDE